MITDQPLEQPQYSEPTDRNSYINRVSLSRLLCHGTQEIQISQILMAWG